MFHLAAHAAADPERSALTIADRSISYGELDARSNRVAHLLRDIGIDTGGTIAVLTENRSEFFDITWGAIRAGIYITPVNWHLTREEASYIITDCGAGAVFASADLVDRAPADGDGLPEHRYSIGGNVPGWQDFEAAIAGRPSEPIDDQSEGTWMLYSSGTTGRPKGIKPASVGGELGGASSFVMLLSGMYGVTDGSVYLCPAPLYHAAPAGWTNAVQRLGGTVVVMERFDPVETLQLIERYGVTHVQFVPTHLIRILRLPPDVRQGFDLSSLEVIVHAAAPCPEDVKRAAFDFFGPIIHEYYSGSEGAGFCAIGPQEWLDHPGSVGRSLLGAIHVLDDDGNELPPGEVGQVWFESAQRFEYHGDPDKTAEALDDRGFATLGDIGYVDEDGYLYLRDRVSNMIISGGVNIYPREIEDVLIGHPAVADVAVLGVSDPEMGESVRAVVQLLDPDALTGPDGVESLETELITYTRDRLSHFKCPRSVVFIDELPRLPTGKIAKRLLPDHVLAPGLGR